jgi:putative membrane protein
MLKAIAVSAALALAAPLAVQAAPAPTDAQIAHIAYTAGTLDVAAGKQALAKSQDKTVRASPRRWSATTPR